MTAAGAEHVGTLAGCRMSPSRFICLKVQKVNKIINFINTKTLIFNAYGVRITETQRNFRKKPEKIRFLFYV